MSDLRYLVSAKAVVIGLGEAPMTRNSCKLHRFPVTLIQRAGWLYFPFTRSLRDVEERLPHLCADVS